MRSWLLKRDSFHFTSVPRWAWLVGIGVVVGLVAVALTVNSGGSTTHVEKGALEASVTREYQNYLLNSAQAATTNSTATVEVRFVRCGEESAARFSCTIAVNIQDQGTVAPSDVAYPVRMTSGACWIAERHDQYSALTRFQGCISGADRTGKPILLGPIGPNG